MLLHYFFFLRHRPKIVKEKGGGERELGASNRWWALPPPNTVLKILRGVAADSLFWWRLKERRQRSGGVAGRSFSSPSTVPRWRVPELSTSWGRGHRQQQQRTGRPTPKYPKEASVLESRFQVTAFLLLSFFLGLSTYFLRLGSRLIPTCRCCLLRSLWWLGSW
jgi:hypothetical protein